MQKADLPQGKWQNVVFFLTALLVVAADQLTKVWIRAYPEGYQIFRTWFFRLIHIQNAGAAFGLFQDQSFLLTITAIIGCILLLLFTLGFSHRFPPLNNRLGKVSLGLILGGTVGNLIDRLNPNLGGVTDFIGIGIWPVFNIADSSIVVGATIFVCALLFPKVFEKH